MKIILPKDLSKEDSIVTTKEYCKKEFVPKEIMAHDPEYAKKMRTNKQSLVLLQKWLAHQIPQKTNEQSP